MALSFLYNRIRNVILNPVKAWEIFQVENRPVSLAEKLLRPPEHKKIPLIVTTFILIVGAYIITGRLLTIIIDKVSFAFFA